VLLIFGGMMLEDITPHALRCDAGWCVAVYKTEDGKLLVIGKKPEAHLAREIASKVGPDEEAVVIDPEYFSSLFPGNT
jgi:hypothetical protein